jgi:hypothetical protein
MSSVRTVTKKTGWALATLALGVSLAAMPASTAASAPPAQLTIGPNKPAPRPLGPLASGATAQWSYNWSGYVAGNGSERFKSVASTYIQPSVTCPVSGAYTVFWVGVDGWFDNTVEQDGTLAYCSSAGGQPVYYAWWEMYPTNSIQWWFPINAGDKIKSSVKFMGGKYILSVKDVTAKTHQTTRQVCAGNLVCERTSADWVVERPGYGGTNYAPLADWGTMSLEADKASTGGRMAAISSFPSFGVNMINNGLEHPLATVGALDTKGTAFSDTWDAVG